MTNTTRVTMHVVMTVGLLVAFTSLAGADVMITQKTHTDAFELAGQKNPASDETTVTWLGDGVARMDQGDTASWIFLTEEKTIYSLDHRSKTYMEIQIGEGGAMSMPGMEGMMEGMDPEEAEEMQKMMGGMMKSMMQLKVEVTETGEKKKIKDWDCRRYTVNTEVGASVNSAETWATEDIEVDVQLFNAISKAFMSMMPGYEEALKEMSKVKGVTVSSESTTQVMGATMKSSTELLEYKEADAPKGTFEVPKGYKLVEE
jgi:hypothetical protein